LTAIRVLISRLLTTLRGRERDLAPEIEAHLELLTEQYTRSGLSEVEARQAAHRAFGNITHITESYQLQTGWSFLDALARDIRFASRLFQGNPWFSATAVMTVAIGIGSTTAVFTVADQLLFRPPPYLDGDRLVQVVGLDRPNGGGGNNLNAHRLVGWQMQHLFEQLEAFAPEQFDVAGDGEPDRMTGFIVTTGLFPMLGVEPARGRNFDVNDGRPVSEPVVILGDDVWRARFGGSEDVLGKTIVLNDRAHRIVGVMSARFRLGRENAIWLPFDVASHDGDNIVANFIGIGRLPAGASLTAAQARADALAVPLNAGDPQPRSWFLGLHQWKAAYVSDTARTALFVLLGAVGFVLLIACANVANLLLSRGVGREREFAVRSALGASRGRLLQQGLVESVLLSAAGGALGVALAWLAVRATLIAVPQSNAMFLDVTAINVEIDRRILLFAAVVTCATSLMFGLLPAIRTSRPAFEFSRRVASSGSGRSGRMSGALVVAEVAFSMILLVGAALMTRSFLKLGALDPGFDPHGVVWVTITVPSDSYPTDDARDDFFAAITNRLSTLAGVGGVASATGVPPTSTGFSLGVVEGDGVTPRRYDSGSYAASLNVTPSFFRTLGIPMKAGRTFEEHAAADSVIVNELVAARLWPEGGAVGRRIRTAGGARWSTIVGVVGDVEVRLGDRRLPIQLYYPMNGGPAGVAPPPPSRRYLVPRRLIVRAADPVAIVPAIKSQVWALDDRLPVQQVEFADDAWAGVFGPQRFVLMLMGLFSGVAVVLAAAGLFAVLSHAVAQRTHEIGVRVALGATQRDIVGSVLSRALVFAIVGVGLGLVGAAVLSRLLSALLFEVSPYDAASFAVVSLGLVAVALLASWLPAYRAARVDPMVALRCE
jgi:putative ABC transport system permease protein